MHLLQTTAEAGRTKMELETAYEEVQSAKLDTEQLRVALEATEGKFNSMLSEARLEAEHVKKVIEKYKLEAEEIMTRSTKREGKSMASLREAEAKANASKEELEKSKMEVADLQGTAHQREIQVGMGPAGELRYPSYPESPGTWRFPGIGAFQCYDKFMISNLRATAKAAGKKDWGNGGPSDAGHYNNWPEDTPFFRRDGGWNCPYGEFFLKWYSGMLLDHGERILRAAEAIFRGTGTKLSGKVAGIHWHYGTRSHAPELTAGYYNTRFRDGYRPIASMFSRNGVIFNFTCIEMKDWEQAGDAQCSPEKLLKQVISLQLGKLGSLLLGRMLFQGLIKMHTIRSLGMSVSAYQKMVKNTTVKPMCAFTYLRMSKHLFQRENWKLFVSFVRKMAQRGASSNSWEQEHIDTASFVHATGSLIQEVAALLHN